MRRHLGGASRAAAAVLGLIAAPALAEDRPDEHAAGRAVYAQWCAPCHAAGVTHPGTHALMVKYQGVKSGVLLEWTDLQSDTVKFVVRHGISVMPQFRKTEISDPELDALAKFLSRNTPR
ncbi:MAG TPA: cytochrome c [Steroidobacteraceae bacterium]|nr:cytochrome c [Steroidobacteraceae bacterium]